ncbi:hypothetical protein KM043_016289 [Ampulex compressa]|nr:hypothetical protein KM043_016289 [Ampulex compressa]
MSTGECQCEDINTRAPCAEECICARRGIDYYGVLSLRKGCKDLEIKAAFRRSAIRYNPERQKEEGAEAIFALVAEAYDVLSDPLKRAVYDQYGEEGLKSGVPGPEGFIEPYVYHGEPMRTYRDFFGTESPYPDLLNILEQPLPLFEFIEGRGIKLKEEPLIKTLYLTLPEVFYGGMKKMKIRRLELVGDDKSTTVPREKILRIPVKPGIPVGTKIVFPEEGDQGLTKIPGRIVTDRNGLIVVARVMSLLSPRDVGAADVIFITEDRPDETFRREGSDLHMTVDIFLREALTGTVVTVNTVDGRTLRIPITSVVTPDYQKRVPDEGLPFPENPKQRGNLVLRFDIEFPVYLPVSSKNYIKRAFDAPRSVDIGDAEYVHRLILANKIRRNVDSDVPLRRNPNDEADQLKFICNS